MGIFYLGMTLFFVVLGLTILFQELFVFVEILIFKSDVLQSLTAGFRVEFLVYFIKWFMISTSPFWVILMWITMKRLLISKVPVEIQVDPGQGVCRIVFSSKSQKEIPLDILTYSFTHKYSRFNAVGFYTRYTATRGHDLFHRVIEVVGMRRTSSWTKDQIEEIADYLELIGVMRKKSSTEDLPLWERMIS